MFSSWGDSHSSYSLPVAQRHQFPLKVNYQEVLQPLLCVHPCLARPKVDAMPVTERWDRQWEASRVKRREPQDL